MILGNKVDLLKNCSSQKEADEIRRDCAEKLSNIQKRINQKFPDCVSYDFISALDYSIVNEKAEEFIQQLILS